MAAETENVPFLLLVVLVSSVLWFLLDDVYLRYRQFTCYRVLSVPKEFKEILEPSDFEKARVYARDKAIFGFWHALFSTVKSVLSLVYGYLPFVWGLAGLCVEWLGYDGSYVILQSVVMLNLSILIDMVVEIPWSLWSTFVLEERHGFNNQTLSFFVKDQLKAVAVNSILISLIVAGLLAVIDWAGANFVLYTWAFVFAVSLVFFAIYMDVIAPIFDKFIELPQGELRAAIEALVAKLRFPMAKLLVVQGSRRSTHSNAYFFGFFKNKRIVLFDTLLEEHARPVFETDAATSPEQPEKKKIEGCTTKEVLAVLTHELGHWQYNHVFKNFLLSQVHTLVIFYLFGTLKDNKSLYEDFGFDGEARPTLIGLMLFSLLLAPIDHVLSALLTKLSRHYEFQADNFAAGEGHAVALQGALLKLNRTNLGFPIYDPLYSALHHSHPTLIERLKNLRASDKKTE